MFTPSWISFFHHDGRSPGSTSTDILNEADALMQSRVNDTDRTRDQSTLRPGNTGSSSATPTTLEISMTPSGAGSVIPTIIGSTSRYVIIFSRFYGASQ